MRRQLLAPPRQVEEEAMKPASIAFVLLVILIAGAHGAVPSLATPSGTPAVSPGTIFVGDSTSVSASWSTDEMGPAILAADSDIGQFISASAIGGNDLGAITGIGTDSLSIGDDVDNLLEGVTGAVAVFTCTSPGTTTFTLTHQGNTSDDSSTLTCETPSSGEPGNGPSQAPQVGLIGPYQIVVTASPNLLPCEGGTTTLTAEAVDASGHFLANAEFRFFTDAGTLVQTSGDTARLTLGANQTAATVRATIANAPASQVEEATTFVELACNDFATVVVTASPNVVDCTGTTTITASARDANGHVVTGVGFHFVTSAGLLTVSPNDASTEEGTATLTLRPGDGDATVVVSVGPNAGTYEELDDVENEFVDAETGMVTVKQNCLSTTTGQIRVNSSSVNVSCGENVFIGLHVIDEDIQTVVDNTAISLIATAGGFFGGAGSVLPAAQVPTTHGEANVIYTAPANFNGEVKITAASGDVYGFTTLTVTCVATAMTSASDTSTGSGTGAIDTGTSAPTTPSCTPIGDGVCVPNRITPPSTGSAGLR
jgi:hypothetical protein